MDLVQKNNKTECNTPSLKHFTVIYSKIILLEVSQSLKMWCNVNSDDTTQSLLVWIDNGTSSLIKYYYQIITM
jgi:hypothetical protein